MNIFEQMAFSEKNVFIFYSNQGIGNTLLYISKENMRKVPFDMILCGNFYLFAIAFRHLMFFPWFVDKLIGFEVQLFQFPFLE